MNIAYIGNFEPRHSTENHVRLSLEAMGHTVLRVQENRTSMDQLELVLPGADLVLYTRTWGLPGAPMLDLWARLKERGIPTVSYHLDLYRGLARTDLYERLAPLGISSPADDPFWRTEHCFTVDGDPESARWFAEQGINHHWMRAGVYHAECYRVAAPERYPVLFVGSYGYHREWDYRPQLIDWLGGTYGRQFTLLPGNGNPAVRNHALNEAYGASRVVVGDTLCPGFTHKDYWCVDEETEILTSQGWKRYEHLAVGELAYTINPETFEGEWNEVEAVNIFPAEPREMLHMESERHSSLTTLDHRWLVKYNSTEQTNPGPRDKCPECGFEPKSEDATRAVSIHRAHAHGWRAEIRHKSKKSSGFKTSRELAVNDSIPLAAPCVSLPEDPIYSDSFVELVAWAWTEGAVNRKLGRYINITQSLKVNVPYVKRIRAALTNLYGPPVSTLRGSKGFAWREDARKNGQIATFSINQHISAELWKVAPDHKVDPSFIFVLTREQLRIFVETSIDADGCRKQSRRKGYDSISHGRTFYQKDPTRLNGFEMACALLGIATSRLFRSESAGYLVHLKHRTLTAPIKAARQSTGKADVVTHDGPVWCPTTKNRTWLAMRRGQTFFTGNSDRVYETLGRGGFLIHPWIDGMELEFQDCEHLVYYEYGDFAGLKAKIDYYLEAHEERECIRSAGHEYVKRHCTYMHRMAAILEAVCGK